MQLSDFLNAAIAPWAALYWSFSSAAQSVQPAHEEDTTRHGTLRPENRLESLGLPHHILRQVALAHPLLKSDYHLDLKLSALPDVRTLQLAAIESDIEADHAPEAVMLQDVATGGDDGAEHATGKTVLVLPLADAHGRQHDRWVQTVARLLPALTGAEVRAIELHIDLQHMATCRKFRLAVLEGLVSLAAAFSAIHSGADHNKHGSGQEAGIKDRAQQAQSQTTPGAAASPQGPQSKLDTTSTAAAQTDVPAHAGKVSALQLAHSVCKLILAWLLQACIVAVLLCNRCKRPIDARASKAAQPHFAAGDTQRSEQQPAYSHGSSGNAPSVASASNSFGDNASNDSASDAWQMAHGAEQTDLNSKTRSNSEPRAGSSFKVRLVCSGWDEVDEEDHGTMCAVFHTVFSKD